MKLRLIIALMVLTFAAGAGQAQSRGALRINEVMVVNDDNVVDDYGRHTAWIELFNSGFAPPARDFLGRRQSHPRHIPHQLHT